MSVTSNSNTAIQSRLNELENLKREAIQREDYSSAQRYKEQIEQIEQSMSKRSFGGPSNSSFFYRKTEISWLRSQKSGKYKVLLIDSILIFLGTWKIEKTSYTSRRFYSGVPI